MEKEKLFKWKKIGGGSFRLSTGKIIKKNQVFDAPISLIPKAFRKYVILVNEKDKKEVLAKDKKEETFDVEAEVNQHNYTLQPRSKGWWDVVDGNKKVMNASPLRKAKGEEMAANLNAVHN